MDHVIIKNSSLFISMPNLILININVMDRKRHMLICFFISMLVDNERGEIVVKISKVVTPSMHLSHSSLQEFMAFQAVELDWHVHFD